MTISCLLTTLKGEFAGAIDSRAAEARRQEDAGRQAAREGRHVMRSGGPD